MRPAYLCIGHCCHDKVGNNYRLGGTASYAAIIAQGLQQVQPLILTSVGTDFQFSERFAALEIPVHVKTARQTTIFENLYQAGQRTQYLLARAAVLAPEDIPSSLASSPIVLFCPIANELSPELITAFPHALKGASIQGFLRQWNEGGLVSPQAMDWSILQNIDIAFLSEEDIRGVEHFLDLLIAHCPQVVVTKGRVGATVYQNGQATFFPAFPSQEVDPTGAGDSFTAAYLIDYYQNRDVRSACIAAHCTASFIIEGEGIANLPSVEEVQERKTQYLKLFS